MFHVKVNGLLYPVYRTVVSNCKCDTIVVTLTYNENIHLSIEIFMMDVGHAKCVISQGQFVNLRIIYIKKMSSIESIYM